MTNNQCAQCQKQYRPGHSQKGCPKCAPGMVIAECEFQKPITAAPAPVVPNEVLDSLGMHDAAVKLARRLGYTWIGGEWSAAPAVPLTDKQIQKLGDRRAIFQAGRDSYETPAAAYNTDDEAWAAYLRDHGIGGGGK